MRRTVIRAVLAAVLLLVSWAVRAQNPADPQPNATDVEPTYAQLFIPFVGWIASPRGVALGFSAAIVLTYLGKRRRAVSVPKVRGRLLQDGRLLRCLEEASRRRISGG